MPCTHAHGIDQSLAVIHARSWHMTGMTDLHCIMGNANGFCHSQSYPIAPLPLLLHGMTGSLCTKPSISCHNLAILLHSKQVANRWPV